MCIALIYVAVQKLVLTSVIVCVLYHWHYPRLAGHLDERCLHDSMPKEYNWPYRTGDMYITVNGYGEGTQKKQANKC